MNIAIDYDGTWTRDPTLFAEFARAAMGRGHTVVLLTGRSDDPDDPRWAEEVRREIGGLMPIVFAGNQWKREALKRAGFDGHVVFIDDNPEYIAPQDPRMIVNKVSG